MSFTKKLRIALVQLCVLCVAACASLNINLPSITDTPTGERMPGKIIWRDLLTNDPAASQRFYGELFGWTATEIEGQNIHFLHVRSSHEDALPLVLTHGWPGSIVEFHKVIGPLVNPP